MRFHYLLHCLISLDRDIGVYDNNSFVQDLIYDNNVMQNLQLGWQQKEQYGCQIFNFIQM